jgi:hypothetical protein
MLLRALQSLSLLSSQLVAESAMCAQECVVLPACVLRCLAVCRCSQSVPPPAWASLSTATNVLCWCHMTMLLALLNHHDRAMPSHMPTFCCVTFCVFAAAHRSHHPAWRAS